MAKYTATVLSIKWFPSNTRPRLIEIWMEGCRLFHHLLNELGGRERGQLVTAMRGEAVSNSDNFHFNRPTSLPVQLVPPHLFIELNTILQCTYDIVMIESILSTHGMPAQHLVSTNDSVGVNNTKSAHSVWPSPSLTDLLFLQAPVIVHIAPNEGSYMHSHRMHTDNNHAYRDM